MNEMRKNQLLANAEKLVSEGKRHADQYREKGNLSDLALYYIYVGELNGLQDAVQTLHPEEKMLANVLEAKTKRLTYEEVDFGEEEIP